MGMGYNKFHVACHVGLLSIKNIGQLQPGFKIWIV